MLLLIAGAVQAAGIDAGERIYREGRLPSGEAMVAERSGQTVRGRDAACVQCHLRSGLGMVEGRLVIPPVTARALFQPGHRIERDSALHEGSTHLLATPPDRRAYDEATLARAIRDGIGAEGQALDPLMPRFDLDEESMRALTGYLQRLSRGGAPGVSASTLHFATVVTPDADPVARDGMLQVLEQYFAEKNSRYLGENLSPLLQDGHPVHLSTQRRWQLHVWQLTGPPEGWEAQLDALQAREPAFALVAGLGGAHWEPVAQFCEDRAVPCLLPNVDLPAAEPGEFYSVYYYGGVLLEADLIAAQLHAGEAGAGRIVQVYRSGDIGAAAAARLCADMAPAAGCRNLALADDRDPADLAAAARSAAPGDTLVLWLRGADLARLPAPVAGAGGVYVSGILGGLEHAPLAPAWRARARMTYPFALPQERSLRLNYPLGWFRLRGVPVVAERVQVNTYVACSILLESVTSLLDAFVPDHLVEQVEASMDGRIVNGYYTRLGLGPGQRFASKGGYLVRFDGPAGERVVADGAWRVP